MIEAYSLYSGSSGNAYLVHSENTAVLVDAGRSSAALCRAVKDVGFDPQDISAVLVTHEHSDHVSALRVFNKKYSIPIIGAVPVLRAVCENEEMCSCAKALPVKGEFLIGDIAVGACATPHDSSANVCYRFRTECGDSLAIATDMGEVTEECAEFLKGVGCAVIESNHDRKMLKYGTYPAYLKSRIASSHGHLSNDQCGDLAVSLAQAGTKAFLLAHLSRENNTPDLAFDTVRASLDGAGFCDIPMECAGESRTVRIGLDHGQCFVCAAEEGKA